MLAGTILWQTFINSLNSPTTSIEGSKEMLAKLKFPREAVLLGGLSGQMLFNLLIQLVLLAVLLAAHADASAADRPAVPRGPRHDHHGGPGIGLILTPLGLLYTDIPKAIQAFAPFVMFLTPVLYAPPTQGPLAMLNHD